MEHRCSHRIPLQFNLLVHHHRLGTLRGISRDISIEGMHIGELSMALPHNAICTLSIEIENENIEVDALVVHSDNAGTGVLFSRPLSPWILRIEQNPAITGRISLPFLPL